MKYLPFENIIYTTPLDIDEVKQRLERILEPKKVFRIKELFSRTYQRPYCGTITGNSFRITRRIIYNNAFQPQIKGEIEKDLYGVRLHVKMRLHPLVLVFMSIWLGITAIICLATLVFIVMNDHFEPMTLIPFGMLIFGYALMLGGFKYESIKSKSDLAQLWEASME